jgi:DNA-binding CsgD family transcriptional regulator
LAADGTALIGRDRELSRLRELVSSSADGSQVLVLLGDAGMGKTILLSEAVREARSAGMRVLSVAGRESEQNLAFAGLHLLLLPVLDKVSDLPDRQEKALLGAFGLAADVVPPDALLTGIAVRTLLSELSGDRPLLVIADDVQWLDHGSLAALAFTARRLGPEQLVLLIGVRGNIPPPGFERDVPELLLGPLSGVDAGRLLDEQQRPPRGRGREHVLAQAQGNPLALIELSRMIAADPGAGRRWAAEPLPLTDRLTAIMAVQFGALPDSARAALLLAAVADSPALTAAGVPGLSADALAPAEAAGLIQVRTSGAHFTHPLVRAAVYHAVPFAERAAAHLRVADALAAKPDRRAWHLASAALAPDEAVAALLEDTAAQAQRRGGAAAAARALDRAAELSPRPQDQVRRLLAASLLAMAAGQADWVQELAARVLTVTEDPGARFAARLHISWALVWSNRHAAALTALTAVTTEAADTLPDIAWDTIGLAATVAYQTGVPADRRLVRDALERLEERTASSPLADEQRAWVRACTDPFARRSDSVQSLRRITDSPGVNPAITGSTAWLLDETELAVRLLRQALTRLRAAEVRGRSGSALSALQWACVDGGRWDEALTAAREASDTAAAYKLETVAASASLATATVLAMRGSQAAVGPLLASALISVEGAEYRAFAARARHAAGLAALAEGSYATAYAQLGRLFDRAGTPLHHHVSYLAVADLAAAGVRAERTPETRTLLERALAGAGEKPGSRLEQLAARARGLLAAPGDAEAHFADALANPDGDSWPFERAQLQLDYGEWLRRQRRINEAKPVLAACLETFRSLGAAPWTRRAEGELRACGVTTTAAATVPDALSELTTQQREIVILASRGLANSEIADRLFLSPRTVASHLYRSYPKLGIAGRHQLRDLVDQAEQQEP